MEDRNRVVITMEKKKLYLGSIFIRSHRSILMAQSGHAVAFSAHAAALLVVNMS